MLAASPARQSEHVKPGAAVTVRFSSSAIAASGSSPGRTLLQSMDRNSPPVAAAFHECRSGAASDRGPPGACSSTISGANGTRVGMLTGSNDAEDRPCARSGDWRQRPTTCSSSTTTDWSPQGPETAPTRPFTHPEGAPSQPGARRPRARTGDYPTASMKSSTAFASRRGASALVRLGGGATCRRGD